MMADTIQIKCPFCGAVLTVRPQPGMENKNVTCPVCKQKNTFRAFQQVITNSNEYKSETLYPNRKGKDIPNYPADEGKTEIGGMNFTIGRISIPGTGILYQLKPGRNVIGRKASKSEADFGIDTGANRSMSREHIVIDVKKVPGKGFVHYVSLFKEKVNPTFVGNVQLQFGDTIVLNDSDTIRLPDAKVRFEIPDEEATQI